MRHAAWNNHAVALLEHVLLVANDEPEPALEHGRDLLVRVMVTWHGGAGPEMDPRHRHLLGVDKLAPDTV